MNKKILMLIVVLMLSFPVVSLLASIIVTEYIEVTVTVPEEYALQVTPSIWSPSIGTGQSDSLVATVENAGNTQTWVKWSIDPANPLPTGFTITAKIAGTDWPEDSVWSTAIAPGNSISVTWNVTNVNASPGLQPTFKIAVHGCDSSTG